MTQEHKDLLLKDLCARGCTNGCCSLFCSRLVSNGWDVWSIPQKDGLEDFINTITKHYF